METIYHMIKLKQIEIKIVEENLKYQDLIKGKKILV
jgi:hypothetical protein